MRKYAVSSMITALIFSSGLLPSSAFALVCDGKPVNGVCQPPHLLHDVCPTNVPRGCFPMPSADPAGGDSPTPLPQPKIRTKAAVKPLASEKTPGFEAEYSGATGGARQKAKAMTPRDGVGSPDDAAAADAARVAKFKAGKALADTVKRSAAEGNTDAPTDAPSAAEANQ